jgi:ParB family chromosome partitioning protein
MEIVDLRLGSVVSADWNPNQMDQLMRTRLERSIQRFGLVVPLVVRELEKDSYEIIGGTQRSEVLKQMGFVQVPCVIVRADDAEARLLAQALNHIAGQDDLGFRAELMRHLLSTLPQEDVLAVLPETAESLQSLATLGQQDLAEHLAAWQKAQEARLRHLTFQLTSQQSEVVGQALEQAIAVPTPDDGNPNKKGTALATICRAYLDTAEESQ